MDLQQLQTAQDRIAWAIDRAKKNGLPPEALAARIGVSRPGMLHWTKETTNVQGVGIGLLMKFSQASGVNLDWIMTGRGDPTSPYTPSEEVNSLLSELSYLAQEEPAEYRAIVRIIKATSRDARDRPSEE